jgi:large subunit ribosomal protein L32e|tara:strand:- start:392 stop:610 length:219 start_codon:yes stop_codon:yes gene_type:complete
VVQSGFRGPANVRGLHPSGFEEVRINTPKEVENVDPKTQAIRIARTVGDKKREIIVQKADEMGIRVFNRRDL